MPHVIDEMLEVVRVHLGMDVAFVSSIESGQRIVRHVAAAAGHDAVRVGDSHPLEATYCTRIVAGGSALLTPDMIRLCVGIEHIDDILADLEQALKASQG